MVWPSPVPHVGHASEPPAHGMSVPQVHAMSCPPRSMPCWCSPCTSRVGVPCPCCIHDPYACAHGMSMPCSCPCHVHAHVCGLCPWCSPCPWLAHGMSTPHAVFMPMTMTCPCPVPMVSSLSVACPWRVHGHAMSVPPSLMPMPCPCLCPMPMAHPCPIPCACPCPCCVHALCPWCSPCP